MMSHNLLRDIRQIDFVHSPTFNVNTTVTSLKPVTEAGLAKTEAGS